MTDSDIDKMAQDLVTMLHADLSHADAPIIEMQQSALYFFTQPMEIDPPEKIALKQELVAAVEARINMKLTEHPVYRQAVAAVEENMAAEAMGLQAAPHAATPPAKEPFLVEEPLIATDAASEKHWLGSLMEHHGGKVALGAATVAAGGWALYEMNKRAHDTQKEATTSK